MMEVAFNCVSDEAERILASWWGFTGFSLLGALCAAIWGWDGIDRWLTVTGTLLVMLLINQGRRSDQAMHLKLDTIDPDDSHNEIESRSEREIKEARHDN